MKISPLKLLKYKAWMDETHQPITIQLGQKNKTKSKNDKIKTQKKTYTQELRKHNRSK